MTTTSGEEENLGYAYGLAALQFFASPGEEQVASWHKVVNQNLPWFFREHEQVDRSSYYFLVWDAFGQRIRIISMTGSATSSVFANKVVTSEH